jgi:PAS domain S-box-containing protein
MLAADLDGIIIAWNHAAEALFLWSAEVAVGMNVSSLIASEGLQHAHEALVKRYLAGAPSKLIGYPCRPARKLAAKKKDGSVFPVMMGVADVPAVQEHNNRFFLATFTDLSNSEVARTAECIASCDNRCVVKKDGPSLVVSESSQQLDDLFGRSLHNLNLLSITASTNSAARLLGLFSNASTTTIATAHANFTIHNRSIQFDLRGVRLVGMANSVQVVFTPRENVPTEGVSTPCHFGGEDAADFNLDDYPASEQDSDISDLSDCPGPT